MNTETKPVCPRCSSELVVQLGAQKHCNCCGLDFDISRNVLADEAARRKREGVRGNWRPPK